MAGIQARCDVVQGFNFQKDIQTPVGHLTTLKISTKQFAAKLMVQDPEKIDKGTTVPVVGVISNIRWDGGFAEPITFTCQVTAANREAAAILTHTNLANTAVEFAFNVYEFDAGAATPAYYLSFHTNKKPLKGLIEKSNGELELDIDSTPSPQVVSPRNYELYLSVMPNDAAASKVYLAVSTTAKFVKNWGVKAK